MNKANFKLVLDHIKSNVHLWNQANWHCGSSHCFFGWAQILAGKAQNNTEVVHDARVWLDLTSCEAQYISSADRTLEDFEAALTDEYSATGYNKHGYNRDGFDCDGYNSEGFSRDGYDKHGRDRRGYDRAGYDHDGFNREGRNRDGFNRAGYDIAGYDRHGYHCGGYNRFGYDRGGYDYDGLDKYNKPRPTVT